MTLTDTLETYTKLGAVSKVTELKGADGGDITVYDIKSDDVAQTLRDVAASVSGEDAKVEQYEADVRRLDGTKVGVAEQVLAVSSGVVVGASSVLAGALRFWKPLLYIASGGLIAGVSGAVKRHAMLGGPNNVRDVFRGERVGGLMRCVKAFSVNTAVNELRPQIPSGVHLDTSGDSLVHQFVDKFTTTGHALYAGTRLRMNKDRLCNPVTALHYETVFLNWISSIEADMLKVFYNDRYVLAANHARLEHTALEHAATYGEALGFEYHTALKESYGAAFLVNNYCAKVVDFYSKGNLRDLLSSDEVATLDVYFKLLDRSAVAIAKLIALISPESEHTLTHSVNGIRCPPVADRGDTIPRIGTILGEQSFGIFSRNYDSIPTGFTFAPLARRAGLDWPEYAPEEVTNEKKA